MKMFDMLDGAVVADDEQLAALADLLVAIDRLIDAAEVYRCRADTLSGWCSVHQQEVEPGELCCPLWQLVTKRNAARDVWSMLT